MLFSGSLLSTVLPQEAPLAGCVALTEGLDGQAHPFSLDTLFGAGALLGPVVPESSAAAGFFSVSAPVYLCNEVTSTFNIGYILAKKGILPAWGGVLASQQSEGRGQFRRHWQSPRGNLYVTFRLPEASFFNTEAAALFTGMLLSCAFHRLGYPLQLKWPNDLLNSSQKKVAGILVEKRSNILLAGVGINLRVLPEEEQLRRDRAIDAGLLETIDGKLSERSPFALWQALVNEAISLYSHFLSLPMEEILPDLADRFLAWKGQAVTISDVNGNAVSGILKGVNPAGGLLLQHPDGSIHERYSGSLARA
jgi:BirA family biotin operon repressor/biotin-[acetyl-CoA-carboxylase] ligase